MSVNGNNCLPRIAPDVELSALLTFDVIKKSARTPAVFKSISICVELIAVTVNKLLAKLNTVLATMPDAVFVAESERIKQIMLLRMVESDNVPTDPANGNVSVPSLVIVITPPPSDSLLL